MTGILNGIPDSWCTYMEGTRTGNMFCLRNRQRWNEEARMERMVSEDWLNMMEYC